MRHKYAYLAGIMDGEGTFSYTLTANGRGEKHYYPRMCVGNTDKRLIYWLKGEFGGNVSMVKMVKYNANWKDMYRWQLQGKNVVILAKRLLPYLIVKQEQVLRVL